MFKKFKKFKKLKKLKKLKKFKKFKKLSMFNRMYNFPKCQEKFRKIKLFLHTQIGLNV